jgi:hypothetical protein
VALFQLGALSAVVGWGLATLRRVGAPRLAVITASLAFALSPVNDVTVITLWKDIPYSTALLALSVAVLQTVNSEGKWLNRRQSWIVLGLAGACVALYRHNGAPVTLVTMFILLLVYRQYWRSLVIALLISSGLWLVVQGPVYDSFRVQRIPYHPGILQIMFYHVAAHIVAGTPLDPDEKAYIDSIRSTEAGWPYNCYVINSLIFDERTNFQPMVDASDKLTSIFLSLAVRDPQINIDHILCGGSMVWRISQPATGYLYGAHLTLGPDGSINTIIENELGLYPEFLFPEGSRLLANWIKRSEDKDLSWLVWRPALYLYLSITGALIVSLRSRNWKYMIAVLPAGLQTVTLIFGSVSQDFRYQFGVYLYGLLAWLLILAPGRLVQANSIEESRGSISNCQSEFVD